MHAEKYIAYAYATSPSAAKCGFAKTGCFCLEYGTLLVGFDSVNEAFAAAEKIDAPYASYSLTPERPTTALVAAAMLRDGRTPLAHT